MDQITAVLFTQIRARYSDNASNHMGHMKFTNYFTRFLIFLGIELEWALKL
jgi:hypothetical protein